MLLIKICQEEKISRFLTQENANLLQRKSNCEFNLDFINKLVSWIESILIIIIIMSQESAAKLYG